MLHVQWIADFSDYRADYARFTWMRLAREGKISYEEITKKTALRQGVSTKIISSLKEGIACFLVRDDRSAERGTLKMIIDNCDGFTGFSDVVVDVDLYITVAYVPSLYVDRRGITPYRWQEAYAMEHYRKRAQELIFEYERHFQKIRPFIPHQMQMWDTNARGWKVYYRKAKRYIQKTRYGKRNLLSAVLYWTFLTRYRSVMRMRTRELEYDSVVLDSLWAWPGHRVQLHRRLRVLQQKGLKILARMNSAGLDPKKTEMGKDGPANLEAFPELSRVVTLPRTYEEMIARSRLWVFATGKHWGWREIAFVALACGIPIFMDRPLYRPYFDLDRFQLFYTENEWEELEYVLGQIDDATWSKIKEHNQAAFDETCSPEAVGKYLMDQCRGFFANDEFRSVNAKDSLKSVENPLT